MDHIQNYKTWKTVDEQKARTLSGLGKRVVGTPIDDKSFKIKIIRDADVIDDSGHVTPEGWTGLLTWAQAQPSLRDLATKAADANNFISYIVNKDTERKQLITFVILPRKGADGKDVVAAATKLIRQDELKSPEVIDQVKKANNTMVKMAEPIDPNKPANTAASSYKITADISFDNIKTITKDQPLFKAVDDAYVQMIKSPDLAKLPILAKVKAELKTGTLGDSTTTLAKAIIAGFGLKDKYGDSLEIVNQSVVDKIALFVPTTPAVTPQNSSVNYLNYGKWKELHEQTTPAPTASTLPAGFDIAAFIKALGTPTDTAASTADIKKSTVKKGDPELIKAQQLILDKFATKLAKSPLYIKFKGYGADGNYGPTTEKIVAAIKAGFKLKDTDGSTITAELLNKINTTKIDESYLDLNYQMFEQFDMGAYEDTVKVYKPSTGGSSTSGADKSGETKGDSSLTGIDTKFSTIANEIKAFVENKENFSAYSGDLNDDEQGAWDNVTLKKFNTFADNIKKELVPLIEKIKTSDADNYASYIKTLDEFGRLLKGQKSYFTGAPINLKSWTYKFKFLNPNTSKVASVETIGIVGSKYEFMLYLSSGVKKIAIPYDVM